MTKKEYLSELESHLVSISEEERINAIQFYDEYFEDAGPENEQQVISELGKPFALAKSIICEQSAYSKSRSYSNYKASISINLDKNSSKSDFTASEQPHTQYTAYNYGDNVREYTSENTEEKYGQSQNDTYSKYEQYKESYTAPKNGNDKYDTSYKSTRSQVHNHRSYVHNHQVNVVSFIIFILLIIFVIAPFVLVIGAVSFAMIISSIICIIVGIVCAFTAIFKIKLFFLGLTLLLVGLAMMFAPIGFILATKLIPKIVKYTFGKLDKLSGGTL